MHAELVIDGKRIHSDSDCYVIAEVGHNHQGNIETAMEMFRVAKECGVDAVKLQKRDNKSLYTKAMYDKPYDHENSFGDTYGAHREALEFNREQYLQLKQYAKEIGITMFATAFDVPSAEFLAELDMPAYKLASGDLKNLPLIRHVAKIGKPLIISTGGGTIEDVRRAHDAVMAINPQLCILQCTACYPASPEELNIRVIEQYRREFPRAIIGLSDHENGIAMAIVSYVLGGRVVEQHFTLNHTMKGTDHAFSLEPIGMKKLVRDLRRARLALGDGVKKPLPNEAQPLLKMGKKLVAARNLPAGHCISEVDIAVKSPGDGIPPCDLEKVLGKKLAKPVSVDQSITLDALGD